MFENAANLLQSLLLRRGRLTVNTTCHWLHSRVCLSVKMRSLKKLYRFVHMHPRFQIPPLKAECTPPPTFTMFCCQFIPFASSCCIANIVRQPCISSVMYVRPVETRLQVRKGQEMHVIHTPVFQSFKCYLLFRQLQINSIAWNRPLYHFGVSKYGTHMCCVFLSVQDILFHFSKPIFFAGRLECPVINTDGQTYAGS